jgi:tripeptide aminopeptidase
MDRLIKNFLTYVKIDTQSNYESSTFPSTEKQKNLSVLLKDQLINLGFDAILDDYGYVYAKIPSNTKGAKDIGFVAHVDTSPDAPGYPVNPRIIYNYTGDRIELNENLSMHPEQYPSLSRVIGDDIIVTDGHTLLGADDKCGVAEIMEIAHVLSENKNIPHGDIHICFTPDEEIGKGANHFDYQRFNPEFAYTMDGSEVGIIEYENFNAATAKVNFTGISIHPGTAKNKMVNALHLAMEFHQLLPVFLNPAYTEGYEGFNHLSNLSGEVEKASSKYIVRNHDLKLFETQKEQFLKIAEFMNQTYGYHAVKVDITDSYFNMANIIKDHMHIVDLAYQAISNCGLSPRNAAIRGGTDGARLTFEGLPCPNLGTGGYQFHGRLEFASIQQMKKAVDIMLEIISLRAK